MAAYAALVSLLNVTEQIQNHPYTSVEFESKQIESFREKICFLLDFVEANSRGGEAEADLETQIASAAYEAEDVIESRVIDQFDADASTISLLDLQTLIEVMDCIKEKVIEFKQANESKPTNSTHAQLTAYSMDAASSIPPMPTNKSAMIGFEDELIQLMEMLVGQESSRKIIPIDGMGGIGKTTLARNTFENRTVVNHFDIQAWVTVSQTYNAKAILLEVLESCKKRPHEDTNAEDYELGEAIHKILWGRRYLIVLDDVWSVDALEKIMCFFPENNNTSRIVVTTRLSTVSTYFGSSSLSMNLLDEEKSWKLFCEKAFGQGINFLPELEEIGREITEKCKGLPLSITLIGGLLGKSSMTLEYWESVAADINSIMNSSDGDYNSNVISLSYTHLPAHLKPCFLYMGVYPEDHEIRVGRLIKLWVSEGFLKPNKIQTLEEIAESYVMDLVGRNLVIARQWGVSGKLKSCIVHDLVRDLCLRISEKEKFLRVVNDPTNNIPPGDLARDRRLVLDGYQQDEDHLHCLQPVSLARTLICRTVSQAPFVLRMLRVLDDVDNSDEISEILSQQVNMRYIAFGRIDTPDPSSYIFMFWNLETIITRGSLVAPLEIWEMPQLRHVESERTYLPDPPIDRRQQGFVLQNLQTLTGVVEFSLSEEVCRRIPNVRKLGLVYRRELQKCYISLGNLFRLHILKTFRLYCLCYPNRDDLLRNLKLPSSIQKLTLGRTRLCWEDLAVIGSLPNLQVLKLLTGSVDQGSEWNPIEGQFLGLKYLKADRSGELVRWNADWFHFPVLERLHLEVLSELEEIPLGIGDIPTLQLIHLEDCSESSAISALKILEEQEGQGNEGIQVRIAFFDQKNAESFMDRVDLPSKNVTVQFHTYSDD